MCAAISEDGVVGPRPYIEPYNAALLVTFLDELDQVCTVELKVIVWDNVSFHHAHVVQAWFQAHAQFTTLYLTPYSPFLNPIDWKMEGTDIILMKMDKLILLISLLQGVWCEEWPITLPEKIEALSGSCVTINCRFDINNKYDNDLTDSAAGMWFKDEHQNNNNIVFNSSDSNLFFKGNITGKLKSKNCTTIFYNVTSNHKGKFFFRIEGNGGLKWTYTQKSVSINVIDSPPNPTVQIFKDQMEVEVHEEVLEGSSMCLRCSAKTLCSSSPPTLTWSFTDRLHLNESSRLQLDQQKQTEIISDLNFTATHLQHGVTFICTITYQLQQRITTAQSNITLRVQYAPKISLFSCNRTDVTVCLCEAHGNPSPKVDWFLSGRPVSNFKNTFISEERLSSTDLRSFISLNQSLTHTDTLQCVTINTHGNASQQIQLDSTSHKIFSNFIIFSVIGAAGALEHEGESVYANRAELSPAEADNDPESLHYSSIHFTNTHTESEEIMDASSFTAEYAAVRLYPAGASESSTDAQVIVNAEELKEEVKPKKSDQEMASDSDSQLYAQVKR
ncbi:Schwann cell myelin protein-like [Paramisgurnus dabryanus]|uniref:Schwann cell myelin protein-like n=1 Tax=Paramisgurnus dabryanus TaxID=90735 RepID=UPI003CCFC8D9